MSGRIRIKELEWQIYDYLADMAEGPQTLTELQRNANTYIPLTDIERVIQKLLRNGWVKAMMREDGEVAYCIKGLKVDDPRDWENGEPESYWIPDVGGADEKAEPMVIQPPRLKIGQPTPITLTNGRGLREDPGQEVPEKETISIKVPSRFLEEFKIRIEGRYEDLSEAVRSGMVLTLKLLSSSPPV